MTTMQDNDVVRYHKLSQTQVTRYLTNMYYQKVVIQWEDSTGQCLIFYFLSRKQLGLYWILFTDLAYFGCYG